MLYYRKECYPSAGLFHPAGLHRWLH